jgi:hypothetical protein
MIKTVILLRNSMVMVFDAEGEQIPPYQGQYDAVRSGILRDAPLGAVFQHWFGRSPEPAVVPVRRW